MGQVAVEQTMWMSEQLGDAQTIPMVVENRQKVCFIRLQGSSLNFSEISIIEYFKTKYHFDFQVNTVTNKILQNRSPFRAQFNG